MKKRILTLIILIVLIACQGKENIDRTKINAEVQALSSITQKKDFLEAIREDDQERRQGQSAEIMIKFGKDSKEYFDFVKEQNKLDYINLLRVEAYLENYSYPKIEEVGQEAALTPWLVIHHANTFEDRSKFQVSL